MLVFFAVSTGVIVCFECVFMETDFTKWINLQIFFSLNQPVNILCLCYCSKVKLVFLRIKVSLQLKVYTNVEYKVIFFGKRNIKFRVTVILQRIQKNCIFKLKTIYSLRFYLKNSIDEQESDFHLLHQSNFWIIELIQDKNLI